MRNRLSLTIPLLAVLVVTLAVAMGAVASPASAGAVGGKVTDAVSGKPIPGAYVYWYTAAGDYYGYSYADSNGDWMVAVPDGLWKFRFSAAYHADQWWNGKADKDSADLYLVTLGPQLDMNVALARTPQAHIRGRITDATSGDPISGVTVTACNPAGDLEMYAGPYAQTGADGTYDLTVEPGSYCLVYTHYAHHTVYYQHASTKPEAATLTVKDGDEVTGTDEAMPRNAVTVVGSARDMDLAPVPGIELQLVDATDGHVLRSATTDAEGTCVIDVSDLIGHSIKERFHDPSGVYADLYNNYLVTGTTSFADAGSMDITLGMPYDCYLWLYAANGGEIKGRTLDADGQPVPDVRVWLSGGTNYSVETQSDANGVYDVTGLHVSAGGTRFSIMFNPNDLNSAYLTENYPAAQPPDGGTRLLVRPGETVTADSCLYKKSAITGTVSDAGGPLSGVMVTLYKDDGTKANQCGTYGDGVFSFAGLWPGTYTLGFQSSADTGSLPGDHDTFYGGASSVQSAPRITFDGKTLKTVAADQTLQPWGGVRVDAQCDIEPYLGIDGLDVTLYNADKQAIATSSLREANAYLFKYLQLGTYYVSVSDPRGVYKTEMYQDASSLDGATPLVLTPAASKAHIVMRLEPIRGVSPDTGALPDGSTTSASLHLGIRPQAIACDGDTAFICGQGSGLENGCFVYERGDAGWARKQLLDLPAADKRSVSVDGDVAAVCNITGASYDGLQGAMLYIYRRTAGVWQLEQSLRPVANSQSWGFGASVAVSGDTVIVGAPWTYEDPWPNAGAVFVYVHGADGWTQQARFTDPERHTDATLGTHVALDGDRALVSSGDSGSGAVGVFQRTGGVWQKTAELTPPQSVRNEAAQYGTALALDGDRAIVGAPNQGRETGAAYVFEHQGTDWPLTATLGAADGQINDRFGQSVDLSGDQALVGAPSKGLARFQIADGAAYLFRLSGQDWRQDAEMQPVPGVTAAYFGTTVTLAGRDLFVGSPGETRADGNAGRVHVFSPYVTDAGIPLVADAGHGVLANDVGPQGYVLSAQLVTGPSHGQLQLGADGSFTYTPDAGFVGLDQFIYRDVSGDWQSDPAAVDITVRGTAAPTLTVQGAPSGWVNTTPTVQLEASAEGGIAAIEVREPSSDLWTLYSAPITVTQQGESNYAARSRDVFGNVSTRQFTVKLDRSAPSTRALSGAAARRGQKCALRYLIADETPGSPTANVQLIVTDARGRNKWSARLFARPVNKNQSYSFRCTLAAGKYRYYVYATDAAGNVQASVGSNKLTIK